MKQTDDACCEHNDDTSSITISIVMIILHHISKGSVPANRVELERLNPITGNNDGHSSYY
jgi:hypothetical protein